MTPIFALSLSFDGIRLLHRTPEGWTPVGEVPLDARDLSRRLAALRRAGLALGVPWRGTKLLLPAEQVRTLTLDGEVGLEGAKAALDGATPYAVADLVIDLARDEGRTHVAAVARETLEEAESFAAEHGFSPVCFAARPEGYPGEAFFGPTKLAAGLLGGEAVARESDEPPRAAPEAMASPVTPTAAPVQPVVPGAQAYPAPQVAVVQQGAPVQQGALPAQVSVPPQIALPPEVAPALQAAPAPVRTLSEVLPKDAAPASTDRPAPQVTSASEPVATARGPQPLAGQTRDGTAEPRPAMPPSVAATPQSRPIATIKVNISTARAQPTGAVLPPAARAGSVAAPARSVQTGSASTPSAGGAPKAQDAARKAEASSRIGGKPRHLALALTIILVVLMGAVAVFASVSGQGLSGLFPQGTVIAEAPPTVSTASATLAGEATTSGTAVDAPSAEAPIMEAPRAAAPEGPALPDAAGEAPLPRDLAMSAPGPAVVAEAAAAAVAAAIADMPQEDAGDEPRTAGAAVTPEEAERVYAATGVWLRAPRLPLLPEAGEPAQVALAADHAKSPAEPLPQLPSATPDTPLAIVQAPPSPGTTVPLDDRGFARATPDGTLAASGVLVVAGTPDLVPPTRPGSEPPAPEPALDASGWFNAMAEPPAVSPRLRPADAALPAAGATRNADGATRTGAPLANAIAEPPAVLPPLRPAAPEELLAALTPGAAPVADETVGALAFVQTLPAGETRLDLGGTSLAALRPEARPDGLAPEQEAESAPEELALFDGPRPGLRPEGLAPEMPPAPDVTDAVAAALAASTAVPEAPATEPVAPAEPAPSSLESTLAAIVDNAPDPLAGATPRAVAVARIPGARPRNFDRVVSEQLSRQARAAQPQEAPRQAASNGNLSGNEQAEAGEAEVASSAAAVPSGPTATTVAAAATYSDAMAMRDMNLIGVYGQPGARRALIRMGNGRYLRVGVGDALDGGQVTAIGDNAINFVRRGRTEVLVIPGG